MEQQRFPWQRRVFVLDDPPVRGRYGWPPSSAAGGVPLADERATALIVLRGERGMGKTVALRQEHEALLAGGASAAWLELKQCSTAQLAQTRLRKALTPPSEPGEWHVLLDGLDEGLNDLPQLDQFLEEALGELSEPDRKMLRLRITCRSARWPARREESLSELWGPDHFKIMGLAPLSRDDVTLADQAVGVPDTDPNPRARLTVMVNDLVKATGTTHRDVNARLNRRIGVRSRAGADEQVIRRAASAARSWLDELGSSG
ncbi:hypothetical protein [Streptomyces sp. NPDC088360]|uniref:hypothetical protein n=1 Tax=Streptomyces sp. NPDC088360 TaxID=3154515 RepID=UPI00344D4CD9